MELRISIPKEPREPTLSELQVSKLTFEPTLESIRYLRKLIKEEGCSLWAQLAKPRLQFLLSLKETHYRVRASSGGTPDLCTCPSCTGREF
jgi:hypothetical protein